MIQTYSIESVIADVGWLKTTETLAIRQILGFGSFVKFDRVNKQVHLCWQVDADTVYDAMDTARPILHDAAQATGAYIPRVCSFSAREIDE